MPEYQLYCFAQSGNCYRAALSSIWAEQALTRWDRWRRLL